MADTNNANTVPTDIDQVTQMLGTMIAQGRVDDALQAVAHLLTAMRLDLAGKDLRIAALLKQMYGRKSEKVDARQLSMLLDQLAQSAKPEDLPAPVVPEPTLPSPATKPARTGRRPLPADLPREVVERDPSPEELVCATCGKAKVKIGVAVSELLEYVPAHFKVIEDRRNKYACCACEEGVVIAPVADKVIEKGRPGPGLIAHILVSKYQDHCPLTRLSGIYARHGVDLATSTLADWVAAGADAFAAIYQEMVRLSMDAYLLGTDDTGLRVLDHNHDRGVKLGHMWAYVADNRLVVFDYTPNRKAEGPCSFLAKRRGVIQCDGYAGYDRIVREHRGDVVRAGCLAHVRRKFKEALDAGDMKAAIPIAAIQALYKVEADASAAGDGPDELLARRARDARPAMASFGEWLRDTRPNIPPKTPLGRAITYAINQWESLQVYLYDGRVHIDNNSVEREMRRVAVGRKNYLFAGSDKGAGRAAVIYSVMATCALNHIDPLAYLRDVLDRISRGWPSSRIRELLPYAWAAEHAPKADTTTLEAAAAI